MYMADRPCAKAQSFACNTSVNGRCPRRDKSWPPRIEGGVRRGTVSVAANRFEAAKLIHTARGQIQIIDREGLKKEACSCYEVITRHVDRLLPKR
jgi:hypothetical protein